MVFHQSFWSFVSEQMQCCLSITKFQCMVLLLLGTRVLFFNSVCILVYTFASVHFNFSSCSYCRCLQGGALNSWVFKTSGVSLCFRGIMHSLRWTDCSVWFFFPEHNTNSCEKRDLRNPYSKCLRFSSFSSLLLLFLLNDFPADHPHEFPVCCCGESFQRKRQSHHTRSTDRY